MFDDREYLTPNQIAAAIGSNPDTVRAWIYGGLLHAVDARTPTSSRPKWRVSESAWRAFEELRSSRERAKSKRAKTSGSTKPKRRHV